MDKYKSSLIGYSHNVSEEPHDSDFKLHVHKDYEFFCVVSGNVGYVVEGRVYPLRPGSLMLMRNAEIHKLIVYENERYERYTLNFSPELLLSRGFSPSIMDAFTKRGLGERNLYEPTDFSGITPLGIFRQIEALDGKMVNDDFLSAYVSALLCAVNTAFYGKEPDAKAEEVGFEQRVIDYINEHILDDISLNDVANEMHISASQLNRIFNKLTGTSVYNYILSKRLVYARGLIERGEGAISACQSCGFKDYSSFYRLYKKRFGCSPAQVSKNKDL